MVGAHQILYGSHTPFMDLSSEAFSTCYDQPAYQIWSLYLHLLRIFEMRYKMSEMGGFG